MTAQPTWDVALFGPKELREEPNEMATQQHARTEDFTARDLMEEDAAESPLQNDSALKKDELALIPLRITRVGDTQKGQFGPYAIAEYELLHPADGVQEFGQVFVEGRLMRVFTRHFLNHPRGAIRGVFVKSPTLKSDGKKYGGWQFLPPDAEFQVDERGNYVAINL